MDITCMTIKLLFGHWGKNGFDDCWIDVIHDLLRKNGECIHSTSRKSFSQEQKKCCSAQNLQSNTHKLKKGKLPRASVGKTKWSHEGCEMA
jgi:hypothetical protein